jgi:hypothetical protein
MTQYDCSSPADTGTAAVQCLHRQCHDLPVIGATCVHTINFSTKLHTLAMKPAAKNRTAQCIRQPQPRTHRIA